MEGQDAGISSGNGPNFEAGVPPLTGSLLAEQEPVQSWHNASSRLMADSNAAKSSNDNLGHLSVHVDGLHAPDLKFSFESATSSTRMSVGLGAHVVMGVILLLFALYAPKPNIGVPTKNELPSSIIWIPTAGPGGGGGGGGNQMAEPPKKAELPGQEKLSVPIVKPPTPTPQPPKPEEPKDPALNIPAKTMADAQQITPGMLESAMAASMISQGSGTGNGAGTGTGTGIGPGKGNGLGDGEGGGTGGGVYHVGNGVESPVLVYQVRPNYTADAMRAKVQGVVVVDCVVLPDGTVSSVAVAKSLDSVFGLDQEAVKAAKQWKFKPGLRFGQPVAVQIRIELSFTLR